MLRIDYSKGDSRWKLALLDHEELVEKLAGAAASAGWKLTYQEQTDEQVSHLRFSREEEHENVLAYLWNLKSHSDGHGSHEFYVESNNGLPIRQVAGVKTLLIGYEYFTERFVGWDASRNSRAPIVSTPSLAVSEKDFSRAYPDGLVFCPRSPNEVAVIFYPDALMNYVCNLDAFHGAVSELEQNILRRMSQEDGPLEDAIVQSLPTDRQVAVEAITRHWAETSFRRRVLTAYGNRCAMCSGQSDVRVDVHAVYIVPAGHPEFTSKTRNGLCLCALHHRAFNQGLVAVMPGYRVVVNRTRLAGLRDLGLNGGENAFMATFRTHLSIPAEASLCPHTSTIKTALRVRDLQNDTLEAVPVITA